MRNYVSSETSRCVLTGLVLVAVFGVSRLTGWLIFRPRRPRARANYIRVFTLFWELCGRPTSNNIRHSVARRTDRPLVIPDDSCQVPLFLARFAGTRGFTLFFFGTRGFTAAFLRVPSGGFFWNARVGIAIARRQAIRGFPGI